MKTAQYSAQWRSNIQVKQQQQQNTFSVINVSGNEKFPSSAVAATSLQMHMIKKKSLELLLLKNSKCSNFLLKTHIFKSHQGRKIEKSPPENVMNGINSAVLSGIRHRGEKI